MTALCLRRLKIPLLAFDCLWVARAGSASKGWYLTALQVLIERVGQVNFLPFWLLTHARELDRASRRKAIAVDAHPDLSQRPVARDCDHQEPRQAAEPDRSHLLLELLGSRRLER